MEKLLKCCAFAKPSSRLCKSWVLKRELFRSNISVSCATEGLAEFEARVTPCLPGQEWWGRAVAYHDHVLLCVITIPGALKRH